MIGAEIADLQRLGILPLQHHEATADWSKNTRLLVHAARVTGKNQAYGHTEFDASTLSHLAGGLFVGPGQKRPGFGLAFLGGTPATYTRGRASVS